MLANLKERHRNSSKLSNREYNISKGSNTIEIRYQDGSLYKGEYERFSNGGIQRQGRGLQIWEDGTK